ncbi:MAG: ABC transporter ATP-binding protein [Anaerolineales bacterium]|nr:ABC transporter ATP-binding protein [Anaerolineales bacterium]MCS7249148.1 ABC transporter ATP-binding protein [Anaerolineales bacterium]MDW8162961.1 ABC transporter ATP-binding protein [Anaerolineales bacterium]MDW8448071.1 ABC transporter ATP-binding protein [Anaerolineales bacterium]
MSEYVIETVNLTKKYNGFTAVNNLNLRVQKGEVFGLLGPNGAGKTTTILMLLGLTDPTSGKVTVLGMDPTRQTLSVKSKVGYIPDTVGFYDELTARENLIYIAKLNGLSGPAAYQRIDEVLARVGLLDVGDQRVGTYSRGMRQRLGVADVLLKQPQLIIMDEPTQGLDPERAREFLKMIRSLKEEGITILLSSHLLHQVQIICDRVGLFHRGRMVLEGTVSELGRKVLGRAYRVFVEAQGDPPSILAALEKVPGQVGVIHLGGTRYQIEAESDIRPEVAKAVVQSGAGLLGLEVETQSLDEIYARYFEEVKHAEKG